MRRAALALLAAPALAAAQGAHDALDPAGPQARHIGRLFDVFTAVSAVVLALVLASLLWAVLRRRSGAGPPEVDLPDSARAPSARPVAPTDPARERRMARNVWIATVATVVVLFGLLVASVATGRALSRFGVPAALEVQIVGHQWWWEIQYLDPQASNIALTANELHLPVGRPVRIHLESRDVIHSFWVPSLHGKVDLIPGKKNALTLQVDRPGEYRGQCAEFCGYQHANMGLVVVAEDDATFPAWRAHQREPATEPTAAEARRGKEVFLRGACALCHSVRGTEAGATIGPDLTHLAGRKTLAAGTIPNVRGHLAGWIANAQGVKPGANMPAIALSPEDLQSLVAYLEGLR
jgi:cytochrome c oxidase subunit 2